MVLSNDEVQGLLRLYDPREHEPDPVKARKRLHFVLEQREVAPIDAARTLRYIRQHPEVAPRGDAAPPWLSNLEEHKVRPLRNTEGRIVGLPQGAPLSEQDLDYNSSAIDCLVMVTKLLEVGYFGTDRGGLSMAEWQSQLDPLARALNSLFLFDFTCFDVETLLEEKMDFFELCVSTLRKQGLETSFIRPQNVAHLWSKIYLDTPSPFRFHAADYGRCHTCRCQYKLADPRPAHFLPLPDVEDKSSIAALLRDTFRPQDYREGGVEGFRCKNVDPHPIEQLHLHIEPDLPDVLALTSNHWRHTGDSTPQQLSFRYERTDHRVVDAKYRWLGGIYFNASNQRYKVFWRGQEGHGDTALLEYDSSTKQCMVELLAVSDNPNDMIPSDWRLEGALVFLERIYDRGETRSKFLEELRKGLDLGVRQHELYHSNDAGPSTGSGNIAETCVARSASPVDEVEDDSRTRPSDEDTDMREPEEAITLDFGDTIVVASKPSATLPKRAVSRTPQRAPKDIATALGSADTIIVARQPPATTPKRAVSRSLQHKSTDISTAVDPLDIGGTIVVASPATNSARVSAARAELGSSQREPTRFWGGNPAFPIVSRTRQRSQTAETSIAGEEIAIVVDVDENPFRAANKPRAPPREKELGVHNTYSDSLRPPSGRRSLNVPNPVDYGGLECIQRYRARHGVRQDDLSTNVDPSDLIPISSQKRGAGSTSDPNDWHAGQPLIFREADS